MEYDTSTPRGLALECIEGLRAMHARWFPDMPASVFQEDVLGPLFEGPLREMNPPDMLEHLQLEEAAGKPTTVYDAFRLALLWAASAVRSVDEGGRQEVIWFAVVQSTALHNRIVGIEQSPGPQAPAAHFGTISRVGNDKLHEQDRKDKAAAHAWLDKHYDKSKMSGKGNQAAKKIVAEHIVGASIKLKTVRNWITDWKDPPDRTR